MVEACIDNMSRLRFPQTDPGWGWLMISLIAFYTLLLLTQESASQALATGLIAGTGATILLALIVLLYRGIRASSVSKQ